MTNKEFYDRMWGDITESLYEPQPEEEVRPTYNFLGKPTEPDTRRDTAVGADEFFDTDIEMDLALSQLLDFKAGA